MINPNKNHLFFFVTCIILLVNKSSFVIAQNSYQSDIDSLESTINILFDSIAESKNDSVKIALNNKIIAFLDTSLSKPGTFTHPFSTLNYMGKIVSPDKVFRILNWNLVFSNGTYKYYGYIQYFNKKKDELILHKLIDKSDSIINPKNASLTNEKWYGALYYKIILNSSANTNYYTLLGWDGNNDFTTKKIIELLYFTKNGNPKFGKNIFKIENTKTKRIIFEYSNKAILTLRYDDYLKMIIYEHLSPEKPSQIGKYQFYIPDFSYDGLEFYKGKYISHPAINVHDRKQTKKKKLNNFKNRTKSVSF